ncbi:MAG TPA: hypothetical protein VGV39_18935 [Mesorhizobium sp.]|jgi:Spy/CpxP family protein refolding chaperone|uniref:hypothetical protein n=1 Tax=Mesorhizobium sp. TaxID=1871066 RepID=UPI002DDD79EE|nr:hypothetical protein [Mesorhizobium sp.]HEV2505159.1 hypothetical protein [Mesorhizobium sp.]
MKTIFAAAIASLTLSSAAFAAAPVMTKDTPKATAQQEGTILLAAGGRKSGTVSGLGGGGIAGQIRGACLICGI